MAFVGDRQCRKPLTDGTEDQLWRVRMTSVQSSGRFRISGAAPAITTRLNDEHPRVRAAAVIALGRIGEEQALSRLHEMRNLVPDARTVDAAIARLANRLEGES